jgi:electron transfer flavoprotein beta subunit
MTKHHPVAVLVSAGRHPASGAPRACKGDAVALAMGRALAGNALRVVHVGDPSEPSLRDYLALGAGTVEVLSGIERGRIVPALAAILRDCSLILTGTRAETGPGSGLLPYELSEAMGWPVAPNIIAARMSADGVALRQFSAQGQAPRPRRDHACNRHGTLLSLSSLKRVVLRRSSQTQPSGAVPVHACCA